MSAYLNTGVRKITCLVTKFLHEKLLPGKLAKLLASLQPNLEQVNPDGHWDNLAKPLMSTPR